MKNFLYILLLLFSMNSFAIDSDDVRYAGFSKLSEADKAEVIKMVDEKSKTQQIKPEVIVSTLENSEKWVTLGSSLGKALAAVAKELGVAVNDFATTPIGILTTAVIVWHFIGGAVVHVIVGLLILILSIVAIKKIQNHYLGYTIEYFETLSPLGFRKIKKKSHNRIDSGDVAMWIFIYFCVVSLVCIIIFTY
jgi:hypothetical protein